MENQEYDIIAELFLSKGKTLYSKITRLNTIFSEEQSLSDSINISNQKNTKKNKEKVIQNISNNITFSDDTINKLKKVMNEAFSEVLNESMKNISNLVEVIKELATVIDKKGQTIVDNQSLPFEDNEPFNNDPPFNNEPDFPHKDELPENENELFDLHNEIGDIPNEEE